MRAEPVSPSGALLINALHSPSRQILHVASPSAIVARPKQHRCRIVMPQLRSVKQKPPQDIGVRLPLWISCETLRGSLDFPGTRVNEYSPSVKDWQIPITKA
jgi:hypothetical protein